MAGKIYTKEEADKLFGKVIESVAMDVEKFNSIMAMTETNIMFRVVSEALFILGDDRKVLYPIGSSVTKEEVFHRASKSVVTELLGLSKDTQVIVERREEHTSVTYGNNTMQYMLECPPNCV
jgi:hypothetical protein